MQRLGLEAAYVLTGQPTPRRAMVRPWLRAMLSRGFGCSAGGRVWSYSTGAHMPHWACQASSSFDSGGRGKLRRRADQPEVMRIAMLLPFAR